MRHTLDKNSALHVVEAFKVYGGQVHAVEAFMKQLPLSPGLDGAAILVTTAARSADDANEFALYNDWDRVQGNVSCAAQMGGKGTFPNGLYSHVTKVRDRRILVADVARGVVLAVAMIDNPRHRPSKLARVSARASTYMVPKLIKIDNGSISRVESMVKWMPFGYTSAWAEPNN